jgi:hypothetical protein
MDNITTTIKNSTGSFLLIGDREKTVSVLSEELALSEYELFVQNSEKYGIDNSHILKRELSLRGTKKRICLLGFDNITKEAQNALLKTLEEEHLNTSIIVIVRSKGTLIDTVLSRLIPIGSIATSSSSESQDFDSFLSASYKERQKRKEVSDVFNPKIKTEDLSREDISIFLENVLIYASNKDKNKEFHQNLVQAQEALSLLRFPGSSVKQIVEYIILKIPTM